MDSTTKSLVPHAQNTRAHTHTHTPATTPRLSHFTNVPYTLYNLGGYWPPLPTRIAQQYPHSRVSVCDARANEGFHPLSQPKKGRGSVRVVFRGLRSEFM